MLAKKHVISVRKSGGSDKVTRDRRLQVLETIILVAASLEAFINEYIDSKSRKLSRKSDHREMARLLNKLTEEKIELKLKWQLVPQIIWQKQFSQDQKPWQDFDVLIRLRNDLLHYKGQLHPRDYVPKYLGQVVHLLSKYEEPVCDLSGRSDDWVDRICNYEVAKWAYNTGIGMINELLDFGDEQTKYISSWMMERSGLKLL
jgi:hypothetical protein